MWDKLKTKLNKPGARHSFEELRRSHKVFLVLVAIAMLITSLGGVGTANALGTRPLKPGGGQGFTKSNITSANNFTFQDGSDGGAITTTLPFTDPKTHKTSNKTVTFQLYGFNTGYDTQLIQASGTSMKDIAQESHGNPSLTFVWVADDGVFCVPNSNTNDPRATNRIYNNSLFISAADIKTDIYGQTVTAATGTLNAFAGSTPQACTGVDPYDGYASSKLSVKIPTGSTPSGAVLSKASLNKASYQFDGNGSIIKVTYTLADGSKLPPVTFTDDKPYDDTHNFIPDNLPNGESPFCHPTNGVSGSPGLNFNEGQQSKKNITFSSVQIPIVVDKSGTCQWGSPAGGSTGASIDNPGLIAEKVMTWNGSQIQSLGTTDVLTLSDDKLNAPSFNKYNGQLYDDNSTNSDCSGWALLLDAAPSSSGGDGGTLYKLSSTGNTADWAVKHLFNKCKVDNGGGGGVSVIVDKTKGSTPTTGGGTQTGTNPDTSACVFAGNGGNIDTALEWILCPIITGVSKSADQINGFVEGQLNFSVSDNLTGDVQRAWTVFKDLVSAILVIFMLIMVIAQAVSGGGFLEAYTIKKLMPRLVAAIILMQLSWFFCKYAIGLANDAGTGIAQLMQAPFGGGGNLDLPSLLNHLNPLAAAAISLTSIGGAAVVTALLFSGALITWGWPVLLLGAIYIILALIVALATLLFRNALIIILVMLSPLAFLAWVLPGTQEYWKKWKTNFTKLLVFFPLVMAMIYGGRIFAWVAGGLGTSGPLDMIMVLIGFFGPYFFLPKTFKWGGDLLSTANKAINDNALTKAGRNTANKYLGFKDEHGAGYRKQQALVDNFYKHLKPEGKSLAEISEMSPKERLAYGKRNWRHFGKNAAIRTLAGSPIPTRRATAVMDKKAGEWKTNEIALEEGIASNMYKEFQKGGMTVPQAKDATFRALYDKDGKNAIRNRGLYTWLLHTNSFMEMGDEDFRTSGGKHEDFMKTQGWIDFMHGNPDAYKAFAANLGISSVPFRLPFGGGPAPEHYEPGGKRYDELEQEYVKDPDTGETVPNVAYSPAAKQIIDTGRAANATPEQIERANKLVTLLADSERGHKLIAQSDDPMSVVNQRPEEFRTLMQKQAQIDEIAKEAGAETGVTIKIEAPGTASLKNFIDQQAQSFHGVSALQRLATGSAKYVDQMLGDGYLEKSIQKGERRSPMSGDDDQSHQATAEPPESRPIDYRRERTVDEGSVGRPMHYAEPGVTSATERAVPIAESQSPRDGESLSVGHQDLKVSEDTLANIEDATYQGTKRALRQQGQFNPPPGSVSTPLPRPEFQPGDGNEGDQNR